MLKFLSASCLLSNFQDNFSGDNTMELKDQIRIAREAMGMTHQELAQAIGVSKQAVIFWEEGTNHPRTKRLDRLQTVLCVKLHLTSDGETFGVQNLPPNLKPEDIELALAISRLPAIEREAIETLVRIGERRALEGAPNCEGTRSTFFYLDPSQRPVTRSKAAK